MRFRVVACKKDAQLLMIRLGIDGFYCGKRKIFLKYYHIEYLAKFYDQQYKKIVTVQVIHLFNPTIRGAFKAHSFCNPNDPKKIDFSPISMTMPPILFWGLETCFYSIFVIGRTKI